MHNQKFYSSSKDLTLLDGNALNHDTIMVIETSDFLHRLETNQFNLFTQKLRHGISNNLRRFNGYILNQNDNSHLVNFKSANDAVMCALKIRSSFNYITPKFEGSTRQLNIGIATTNDANKDRSIIFATRMCDIVKEPIVASSAIEILYNKENRHARIDKTAVRILTPSEEQFLDKLMNYIRTVWKNPKFISRDLSRNLGYSKSQIYRKILRLTGKTPTSFIRDFRLNKSLSLIRTRSGIISDIASENGFKSAGYFTKCFKDKFNILPSKYMRQYA